MMITFHCEFQLQCHLITDIRARIFAREHTHSEPFSMAAKGRWLGDEGLNAVSMMTANRLGIFGVSHNTLSLSLLVHFHQH